MNQYYMRYGETKCVCAACFLTAAARQSLSRMAQISLLIGEDSRTPNLLRELFELAKQTLTAVSQLVRSIAELQLYGILCDSLPIIVKPRDEPHDMVEVIDIEVSEIDHLLKSLETVATALQVWNESAQEQVQAPPAANKFLKIVSWAAFAAIHIAPLAGAGLAAPLVGMAATIGTELYESRLWSRLWSSHVTNETVWGDLSATVASIFHALHLFGNLRCFEFFFGSSPTSTSKEHEFVEILHCAASCAQVLCLGLQSFVQAHTGMPRFSFLDHDLMTINLAGAGSSRHTIVAHLQNLTCFESISKGPVLAFHASYSLDIASPGVKPGSEKKTCDLMSSLENVIYIWGDARVNYLESGAGVERSYISNLWIAGGLLHPSEGASDLWHWTPAYELLDQPPRPMTSKKQNEVPPQPLIRGTEKVRIGAVSINPDCPLSTGDGQKRMQTIAARFLAPLHTFPSFWEVETRSANMQAGQYLSVQAGVEKKKHGARTVKQALIDGDNYHLLPRLAYPWGIRACLCTGLIERVTLQEVISPYMNSRIQSPTRPGNEQQQMKSLETVWGIINAFETANSGQWFERLPHDLRIPAYKLIREILSDLGYTGVDKEKMLRLAWLQPNNAIECLKIPCKGGNFWASMLADSSEWNSVAFASITHQCLNTSSEFHDCKRHIPQAHDPKQLFRLCTKMQAKGIDYNSRTAEGEFTLKPGVSYRVGAKELSLVAKAKGDGETFKLNVKPSVVAIQKFRRWHKWTELHETIDAEGVECLVVTEDEATIEGTKEKAKESSVPITRVAQSLSHSSHPLRPVPIGFKETLTI